MDVIKIGMIGIFGTLLALQLKQSKTEYGVILGIVVSIFIFFGISGKLELIVDTVKRISSYISIDNAYISLMLKMLGITYIAEFASDICKDAGYQTIAGQIGVFSKLAILALSMPILLALLETIEQFLR